MLIVCPSCASEYAVDAGKIGLDGRTVRCAACRTTWFVTPDDGGLGPEPFEDGDLTEAEAGEALAGLDDDFAPDPAAEPDPELGSPPSRPGPGRQPVAPDTRPRGAGLRGTGAGLRRALMAGFCLALLAVAVLGRDKIVQVVPETARVYALARLPVNLRGLEFRAMRSEITGSGSAAVLVVEGEITNVTRRSVVVPPVEIALRDERGLALYTWTNDPPRPTLEAAETVPFRARLASPPSDGRQAYVRFTPATGDVVVARSP